MAVIPPPYTDYIPAGDTDLSIWLDGFGVAYGASGLLIPAAIDIGLADVAYKAALAAALDGSTRGPSTIQAKNDARVVVVAIARLGAQAMVQGYLNGNLTAQQLIDGGVRVPSGLQTPRLPPATGPDIGLRGISPGQISFTIFDPLTSSFKKPIGVTSAEVWAGLWTGDPSVPPVTFFLAAIATRKVVNISTLPTVGQQFRYQARWLTVRGANSPFGASIDAFTA